MSDWPGEIDKCEYHLLKSKNMSDVKQSTGNERLPQQECPVRVAENDAIAEQIEQEIKNQIEHDARDYAIKMDSDYSDNAVLHYATGANAQDKIASDRADKAATNRTVEEAIQIVDRDISELLDVWNTRGAAILQSLKEELEKLKK